MAMRVPVGLGSRGRRLWRDFMVAQKLGAGHRELLLEACRLADRLDALDAMLVENPSDVAVVSEARLSAVALKGIVAELRLATGQGFGRVEVPASGGRVVDLAARVAERRGAAAG